MSIDVNCTAWEGFRTGEWRHLVNVRNFIQKNYTPYEGDEEFLAPISERTEKVWDKASDLIVEELKKGIIDVETEVVSGIDGNRKTADFRIGIRFRCGKENAGAPQKIYGGYFTCIYKWF